MKLKNSLYIIIAVLVFMSLFSGVLFLTSSPPKGELDILLEKRIQTAEFKKAKKDKIKHMVICYQGLEKDGFVFNGTAPMVTKEFKLYETLIVYTNEVKNLNNKISFMDYSNKAVYNLDITKKVCRIFDINKI